MYVSLNLLIIGRSRQALDGVMQAMAGRQGLELIPYVLNPGQLLLPEYMRPLPDSLIFVVDEDWRRQVWETIEHLPKPHPPLFIVTQANDMEILRLAMRFGVRDVFPMPLQVEDCLGTIGKVVHDERARRGEAGSRLISFMNTKGGSGSSLIAANVALAMAQEARFSRPILLVDFDFQFGGLPTYLNLVARDGLIKAMEFVANLDATALQAYVLRHPSGLHLLAAAMDEIIIPDDISADRTEKLLSALNGAYDDMVFDLPHRIDPAIATILSHSDVIALATQQTIAHLHDTKRLLFLLRDRLGIAMDRILLLVNRNDAKAEVSVSDFADVFPQLPIRTLPSDYVRASESINLGIPICESAASSPLGKALLKLAKDLNRSEGNSDPVTVRVPGASDQAAPPPKKGGIFGWLKK
jgi:pilus assembly protein CpaE